MKKITLFNLSVFMLLAMVGCQNSNNTAVDSTEPKNDSTLQPKSPQVFSKNLVWQGYQFDVSTEGEGSIRQLTVQPHGLTIDSSKVVMEIDGAAVNAEIGDLNADGFPEVLIYTVSAGSGSYGNVIGYSVNQGKSMSSIYFPAIAENSKANKGYMGHDTYAIVESVLTHSFPIYLDGDTNNNPSGKTRQIQYKLKEGEASRKFEVDKISEM